LVCKNKKGVVMSVISTGEKKVVVISVYNRESWKNLEEKFDKILGGMEEEEVGILM